MEVKRIDGHYAVKIGMKQRRDQADFHADCQALYDRATDIVPESHVTTLYEQAAQRIHHYVTLFDADRISVAVSGGKDASVMYSVAEWAGVTQGILVATQLEFTFFDEWVATLPAAIEVDRVPLDIVWLKEHPRLLFPHEKRLEYQWTMNRHRGRFQPYADATGVKLILLGRRRDDGNNVPRTEDGYYERDTGLAFASILRDWTLVEVLAAMQYRDVWVSPIYKKPYGWFHGTCPWPLYGGMLNFTHEQAWKFIYSLDARAVIEAAPYFPGAARVVEDSHENA